MRERLSTETLVRRPTLNQVFSPGLPPDLPLGSPLAGRCGPIGVWG